MNHAEQASKIEHTLKDRYEKNLLYFKRNMPFLYKNVAESNYQPSFIFNNGDTIPNKIIKGRLKYETQPIEFAKQEVNTFLDNLNRLDYRKKPSELILTGLIKKNAFIRSIENYAKEFKENIPKKPSYMGVIVFGCGLGYHIEMLINKNLFNHITIVEKDINNFIDSLYTINWNSLLTELKKDKKITFIINNKKEDLGTFHKEIKYQISLDAPNSVSSTIIYNHLNEASHKKEKAIINDIHNTIRVIYERIGPDGNRLLNTLENLRNKHKIINLKKTKLTPKHSKVAIIGAGPSLDDYIDVLKKYKNKLFIISCGSSLSSLLKEGIKPDIHMELEYQRIVIDLIEETNNQFDLSGIDLIVSTDAHPGLSKFFRSTQLIVPETSELIRNIPIQYIFQKGGLTCTNGGAAFSTYIHSEDIVFFGLDYAHTNNLHHAKENITNNDNLPDHLELFRDEGKILNSKATLIVKDVFGNPVRTKQQLNSARIQMETLIESSKNTFYNCSNGAEILGSIHKTKDEITSILDKSSKKPNLNIENILFDANDAITSAKSSFDSVYDACDQIKNILISHKEYDNAQLSHEIMNIHLNLAKDAMQKDMGLYRSIMSVNRLPLLLLYNLVNFSSKNLTSKIIEIWLEEYEEYTNFIKEKIGNHFNKNNFLVNENWTNN